MMRLASIIMLMLISGCSWLPDRTLDYRKAETLPVMAVPEGMVMVGQEDLFAVPNAEQRLHHQRKERFELPAPPVMEVVSQMVAPEAGAEAPGVQNTRIVLTRDGNNYPIIMIYTAFPWAWEYVGVSLAKTDLKIDDRSRDAGIFFVKVPKRYGLDDSEAQIKLSHTVNGVQVAVLNRRGTALVAQEPGQMILQRLYDNL
jgi:outer membrane protein assembly factor BamC